MKFDEIDKVAKLMKEYELTEFSLESEDMRLKIKRGATDAGVSAPSVPVYPAQASATPPPQAAGESPVSTGEAAEVTEGMVTIDSPIVGTFYASPAPDAAPFVKAGQEVDEETVVCIVEAMKVMNEIKAECSGTIRRVLVENATPVEYGQPMFELEPA
ncbi:MAG: acetyl-CoA carboxylase biotin carboxyl carrier protein [Candidatus Pacebacteria bacterium]|nr:acetyl-CoA carboxylase biotin carboxyl carrier protein [Candidatus Paceibacterota bacterium]